MCFSANEKEYCLPPEGIRSIVPGRGGCIATDRITVDGASVGYMYREQAANELDSGWRFFAGDESEEYMGVLTNHGVYDLNTIANLDEDVVPFLDAPLGSSFERIGGRGPLVPVEDDHLN